jgi:hypothetical protein
MLKLNELQYALDRFGDKVVADAKANLSASGKVDTGKLQSSLKNNGAIFYKRSIELGISLSYYGAFVEKGVRGAGGVRSTTSKFNRTNNKGKMWKQNGKNSPFSFKEGVKPSVKHFIDWSAKRGLNPFAVRESVYRQGIAPTPFLEDAVKKNINSLPILIQDAFALDVKNTVNFIIKSNLKTK